MSSELNSRYSIRALERAIDVLLALSSGEDLSLSQIAKQTKLHGSTTFRFLSTLEQHRFVQRDQSSSLYRLGPACLELARAYLEGTTVVRASMPVLEELRDQLRETVHLAILDRMQVYYLAQIPGYHALGLVSSRTGSSMPAYCTGLGKALLAFLPEGDVRAYYEEKGLERWTPDTVTDVDALIAQLAEVREKGYALDVGERDPGIHCIAVPIRGEHGEVLAAISVTGPAFRMKAEIEEGVVIQAACEAARSISIHIAERGGLVVPRR